MSTNEIQGIVKETIKQQNKQSTSLQGWIKLIIMFIFIPLITVYSSFRVMEWRICKVEANFTEIKTNLSEKVNVVWYERYIIGQKELIERLEANINDGDAELECKINEVKQYLDELVKEKKLYYRSNT